MAGRYLKVVAHAAVAEWFGRAKTQKSHDSQTARERLQSPTERPVIDDTPQSPSRTKPVYFVLEASSLAARAMKAATIFGCET